MDNALNYLLIFIAIIDDFSKFQHYYHHNFKYTFQIRKLFEPHLYLNATILPLFDQYFGNIQIRTQKPGIVCAVGFEPNPHHTKILQNIQSVYNKCEWKTKIFTTTAAAHCYGMARFFTDNNTAMNEWGGSILKSKIANNSAGVAK